MKGDSFELRSFQIQIDVEFRNLQSHKATTQRHYSPVALSRTKIKQKFLNKQTKRIKSINIYSKNSPKMSRKEVLNVDVFSSSLYESG